MKRIRSNFTITVFLLLSAFFIFGLVAFWEDASILRRIQLASLAAIFPYISLTAKVEYQEDSLCHFVLWKHKNVSYADIARICCSTAIGVYWLITYDNEKYGLYFPFGHKKMRKLFETIENYNPNVQIDVWWYKKQPRATILKTSLKFCLFVLIVLLADFLLHIFKK